ncbi:DUF1598 domain-containing protein [Rubripirellula reticaptiva]|uniref:DUF1598 domain-containing protein n=1 Tax=Rubripirellula reticaptiva TaxID=2528013 RepID=A0A5C6ENR4_9BACT|nr:DUF1598 domain-containing protein [Rubripirellula reticaptiva]TWU49687.1 hypothetical protein Poly59_43090 [Rubripirellula reticaptiva]
MKSLLICLCLACLTSLPSAVAQDSRSESSAIESADPILAPGGASFANFDSLIELIQTTVVPDTWDTLGGPSSMNEYAQGIYVDAKGTVRVCETAASADNAANLKSMLLSPPKNAAAMGDWQAASSLRCVSLRRLLNETSQRRANGTAISAPMNYLAGLSEVQYVFIDAEHDDIVIAGPVGGIETIDGIPRDRESMRGTLRLDFLQACLASTFSGLPFGCTIDPTTEGLQRSAAVAASVQSDKLPIGKAAGALAEALGTQRVEVFGTAGDTPMAYLMVHADRHMKELALGKHAMPRGAMNYLDVTAATIDRGMPTDLLLRLWFTASPRTARADKDHTVFEITGSPIRLSGENERAMASGARGNLATDFRTEMFVADFNKNFHNIRSQYPVYGSLEAIYQTASVAELLRRFADADSLKTLIEQFAHSASSTNTWMQTPTQIESIAVLHKIRHGRSIHNLLIASGGVAVNGPATLASTVADYPSLASLSTIPESRPRVIQDWWWDR